MNETANQFQGLEEFSDADLVTMIQKTHDKLAFETLVKRHHQGLLKRFIANTKTREDAEDLAQQLWMKFVQSIDRYREQGKFPNFLQTAATRLIASYWERHGKVYSNEQEWPAEGDAVDRLNVSQHDAKRHVEHNENADLVAHLVADLIPNLPVEQRTIYLLRHESEHWDDKQRLRWSHIAELNGMSVDTAWTHFDDARRHLLRGERDRLKDSDAACIFFVWTQAQRPGKQAEFEYTDYAEMLDVPANTLKSRYRAAVKSLRESLRAYQTT